MADQGSNQTRTLEVITAEHRALAILRALARSPSGRSNEEILASWLGQLGMPSSRVTLRDSLDHLAARGLIAISQVQDLNVAEITRQGQEICEGLVAMDGVARPSADCPY
ncbi:hypothetical protein JWJ88_16010 [Paracoccus methylovorus]|uniref:ArsR family transcriptional regulator n=1 Tax=Paracoccus methylovorus TaxID=2812658 RepID=A0ABX7JRE5_9RHOB|nr:hypothetical protein [Paracoccus methylovorus]QRZ15798.1 hypothetical protein JWJ88_16010 [Paracoccus methylovorus]